MIEELYLASGVFAAFTTYAAIMGTFFYSRYYSKSWLDTLHAALLYSIIPLIFLTIFKYGASQ